MTADPTDVSPSPLTTELPVALYTCEQTRTLDRLAEEKAGLASSVLMKRAGRSAFAALLRHWPDAASVTVLCGGGNNAGDGYVIAALAAEQRLPVRVLWVGSPDKLKGAARQAYDYAVQEGVPITAFADATLDEPAFVRGVVVDALLGTGISGEIRPEYRAAIEWINRLGSSVLAVDIPSGLHGDTGAELGLAVNASVTVTFIGCKQGLLTGRGPALTGLLEFSDLGVPRETLDAVSPGALRCTLPVLLSTLPPRQGDAHKGQFGHLMVIGGERGYGGALLMAALAAARVGVGLISAATRQEHVAPLLARLPEAMAIAVPSGQELDPYLARPSVLAIGPGLGRTPWSEQMLQRAAKAGLPMVVDADGLNLIAEGRVLPNPRRDNWVLTPHPGEAARLLGTTTGDIQADRFAAARALQERYGGVVVLKGAGSLIADGEQVYVANVGNPGMASGGMGDVLTGIIGALLANSLSPSIAARLGVCLHGTAGDLAAEDGGERGLLATDLIPYVRELLNS